VRVFRFERFCEAAHARADRGSRGLVLAVDLESFERAIRGAAPALHVDRRVAERPIKPWDQRFVVARRGALREPTRERLLKDVFGERAIAETPLQKAQKRAMITDERPKRGIRHSGTLFRRTCSSSTRTSHNGIVRSSW